LVISQLNTQVNTLKAQLAGRPTADKFEAMKAEFDQQELIIKGMQKENENATAQINQYVSIVRGISGN
jgi:hypothetical protein